ncbi:hypothetical protein AMEX_G8520, partial [Astyanax mexicanus]
CCSSSAGLITVGPQCRSDQTCVFYEALEHPMHLQLPSESELTLKKIDERVSQVILKCKKQKILIHLNYPRWQFVSEHRTMIITRAEKNDSGRYRLETFDSEGTNKGVYDFHLTIEGRLFPVFSYACCSGLMVFVSVWLFEVIILVSLLVGAFYIYTRIYRKQRAAESKSCVFIIDYINCRSDQSECDQL